MSAVYQAQRVSGNAVFAAQVYEAGGVQQITPSLYSNAQVFYAPTAQASNTVSPSLFSNSQTFHALTITTSNALTASIYTSDQTFYTPTVNLAGGPQQLTASRLDNADVFYSPLLSPGAVSLAPALYSNAPTFYVPVLQSTVGLLPGLHSNSQSFYPPTLSTSKTLTPSLYSNGQTFYIPTVSIDGGPQQLTASLLDNASIFYSPLLAPGAVNVAPSLYSNAQAFYILTLTTSKTLTPALFANSNTIYDPVVSLDSAPQVVAPSLFANTQSYFTQTVSPGAVSLFPILLTNSSTFYAATVANGGSFTGSLSDEDIARIAAAVLQAIASLQAGPIPVVVANRDQIAADVWGFTLP